MANPLQIATANASMDSPTARMKKFIQFHSHTLISGSPIKPDAAAARAVQALGKFYHTRRRLVK